MQPVVIVGGGFGGLVAARALEVASVQVVLVVSRPSSLFQPPPSRDCCVLTLLIWPDRSGLCFEDSRTSGSAWGKSARSIERRVASCSLRDRADSL